MATAKIATMEQKNDNYEHLVYVECMTYNQSNYIEDALRGFVMQRTDFPFVCMIMDDASTDGEQEIIKSFLKQEFDLSTMDRAEDEEAETIIAKHNTNDNCTFVICLLKENHLSTKLDKEHLLCKWRDLSKYTALCEGDDYWIDSNKLQKQVNFLESNPSISLSCCRYQVLDTDKQTLELMPNAYFESKYKDNDLFIFTRDEAYKGVWITKTLTCVYRTSSSHIDFLAQFKYSRDVHLFYDILSSGDGVCHNFVGGVYRISGQGIFGGKSKVEQDKINYAVFSEFCHKVPDPILIFNAQHFWDQLTYARERPKINSGQSLLFYLRCTYHRVTNVAFRFHRRLNNHL